MVSEQKSTRPGQEMEMKFELNVEESASPVFFEDLPYTVGKVTSDMSHGLVPKNHNMAELYESSKDEPPTTLMIRNIPGKYSQNDLMADLSDAGFGSSYDFL